MRVRVLWNLVFRCRCCQTEQSVWLDLTETATLAGEQAKLVPRIAQAREQHGLSAGVWDCVWADVWLPDDWHCWREAELKEAG